MSDVKEVCQYCGSDNVSMDATVEWDVDLQRWVIADLGEREWCVDCESETVLMTVNVEWEKLA